MPYSLNSNRNQYSFWEMQTNQPQTKPYRHTLKNRAYFYNDNSQKQLRELDVQKPWGPLTTFKNTRTVFHTQLHTCTISFWIIGPALVWKIKYKLLYC